MYRYSLFLFFVFYFSYNDLTFSAGPSDLYSIGVAIPGDSGFFVSTTKNSLQDSIIVICLPEKRKCEANGSDFVANEKEDETVMDVVTGKNIYTYYFHGNTLPEEFAIAVIYPKFNKLDYAINFDERRNVAIKFKKQRFDVFFCASNEGLHFYSASKNIHLYYSLGYDLEADCPGELYK